jgi:hypothetical protein
MGGELLGIPLNFHKNVWYITRSGFARTRVLHRQVARLRRRVTYRVRIRVLRRPGRVRRGFGQCRVDRCCRYFWMLNGIIAWNRW